MEIMNDGEKMSSDKIRHTDVTQTGSMPRIEMEPRLQREAPEINMPELLDAESGSTTGEMPRVTTMPEDSKTQDEDAPKGK